MDKDELYWYGSGTVGTWKNSPYRMKRFTVENVTYIRKNSGGQ